MTHKRSFLNIPYEEHIVPFPNFASVIMQHAREFPDKIAMEFGSCKYTYSELLELCLSLDIPEETGEIIISMDRIENDLILLLALLIQGISFKLDFTSSSSLEYKKLDRKKMEYHPFEPPYVRLDAPAFLLNNYSFSQYNVLVAAQAVGNAFKLFRPGNAYCPLSFTSIADLTFGVLAPLYFAKSIHFTLHNEKNCYQYALNHEINSSLRDAIIIFSTNSDNPNSYKLIESFDQVLGLGPIIDPRDELIQLLGLDINKIDGKWHIAGHCLGIKLNTEN
ncbi:MAG: hypothetical protein U9O95_01490 [Candidatus Marinimicrobia bacterium]|nr:hypothetical protein [Candidatus Neomarinimicrobiota bacterium]